MQRIAVGATADALSGVIRLFHRKTSFCRKARRMASLYTMDDPYYQEAVNSINSTHVMPSKVYWDAYYDYELYSDKDPYLKQAKRELSHENIMPSAQYWIEYQEKMKNLEKPKKFVPFISKVGVKILLSLGATEEDFDPSHINNDPSSIFYYGLHDPTIEQENVSKRVETSKPSLTTTSVPIHQDFELISVAPNPNIFSDISIQIGPFESDFKVGHFCPVALMEEVFADKDKFAEFSERKFTESRDKSNPYETIKKAIFMNRAAMKMANLDALFNFTNSSVFDHPPPVQVENFNPFYFADICAGPGGFTEYLYWRLKERARGFGMTLAGDHDWNKSENFYPDVSTFKKCYGSDGTGDIYNAENIKAFGELISECTDGKMVQFVMADGGTEVEGKENLQEQELKRLVLCQFLCALYILRKGGSFVCKVFDCYTDFSASILYLLAQSFEKFCIIKPYTSRPCNSERYVVCLGLRESNPPALDTFIETNEAFNRIEKNSSKSVVHVLPIDEIPDDFKRYLKESNERLVKNQINSVCELLRYADHPESYPVDQNAIAQLCLKEWKVPPNRLSDWTRTINKEKIERQLPAAPEPQKPIKDIAEENEAPVVYFPIRNEDFSPIGAKIKKFAGDEGSSNNIGDVVGIDFGTPWPSNPTVLRAFGCDESSTFRH